MYYKNNKTGKIIKWKYMSFGDEEKSYCGLCSKEEPGYYRIKFTKPGKLFRKEKTGELHLFVDQNPDTLIMKVIFNGELEQKDTLNWGEGMFADDDAIYEKVAREADKVAMHLMEK
jgi:hypothetical protein